MKAYRIVRISHELTDTGKTGIGSFVETHRLVRYCTVQFSRSELHRLGVMSDRIFRPVRRTRRWSHDEQYIAVPVACQARGLSILPRSDERRDYPDFMRFRRRRAFARLPQTFIEHQTPEPFLERS